MRTIKAIFILCFLTISFGCSDFLDKPPYGVLEADGFFNSAERLKQGLTDAYNPLGFYNYEVPLMVLGNIVTDDSEKGGSGVNDKIEAYELSRFRAVASNSICLDFWTTCYRGIFNCNTVIDKSESIQDGNQELIKRIVAEAKFLRGYYYFNLALTFGGVPLATSALTPTELDLRRSSYDETWDQIERDFSEAAASLPLRSQYDPSDLGRATKGAALAMLAKSMLMRQKFEQAEDVLNQIISSNEYELLDDFGKIWKDEYENSSESLFEVQHENTASGWMNDTEGSWIPLQSNGRKNGGYGFDCPTEDLRDEFEPGDPRLVYTLTFSGDIMRGIDVIDNSESPTGYHNRKVYIHPDDRASPFDDQGYNIRAIRYADVLLLYSEVLNENNKPNDALAYLNMVRERARNTNSHDPMRTHQVVDIEVDLPDITVTDKNELRELIWHERRVELAMEYHRKFDLVRQERYGEVMRQFADNYDTDKGKLFNDNYHYVCPIPSAEIDRSEGKIVQNPGY
jgi:hypothetical protein